MNGRQYNEYLPLRHLEGTSWLRGTEFNKLNIALFFENWARVLKIYESNAEPMITPYHYCDETCCKY